MTLVAVVVAFVANYPGVAFFIIFGGLWALFESGAIVQLIQALSKPSVYLRHPFLAAGVSVVTSVPCLDFAGLGLFTLWGNPNTNRMILIPIVLFGTLGVFCLTPIVLLTKYSRKVKDSQPASEE